MAASPRLPQAATNGAARRAQLERNRSRYRYMSPGDNQLHPVCIAESWPWLKEQFGPSWALPFLPGYLGAYGNKFLKSLRFGWQRMTFRFDKMRAYSQLFRGDPPAFAQDWANDQYFAYRRIAGPNALSIQQERDLAALCERIALTAADASGRTPLERIEATLRAKLGRPVSLATEAEAGRLFACDFTLLQSSLRPTWRQRDSRWRAKYLPAPIGVFLEAPDFYQGSDLVPLAIQIDQPQADDEHNPVYTPDQGWGWKIAKLYFEVADENFHVGCGHVYRTHLFMDPFCMATPRQLAEQHPVYVLLRPHTRFTLAANKAAYKDFVNRSDAYFEFYAGNLEELRQISIQSCEEKTFAELEFEAELESRGVASAPADYPYRDDARLWLEPIRSFVSEYLESFYGADADVREDDELQNWFAELVDPDCGGVRGLVPGDLLNTRRKLIDLLTEVIFVAGPGHAAQHFSQMYYYRFPPAFAASAYAPPPWQDDRCHEARFQDALPPIRPATLRFTYSSFGDYQYDTFGNYRRFALSDVSEAREPIRKLRAALEEVEQAIGGRCETRPLPYPFLLPSRVPNSINI